MKCVTRTMPVKKGGEGVGRKENGHKFPKHLK